MTIKKVLAVGLAVFLAGNVFAQEAQSEKMILSIDSAVQKALDDNISLKQSRISIEGSKRNMDYSWNVAVPTMKLQTSYSIPLPEETVMNQKAFSFAGSMSLGFAPALFTSIKNTKLSYENQEITYESAVKAIELKVRVLFYGLLYEKENLKLLESNSESAKKRWNTNATKYSNGTLSRLDVLSAQLNYQNSLLSLQSAQNTLENDLASFKQVLGIDQSVDIELDGTLDTALAIKDVSLEGIEFTPVNVKIARKQLEMAKNGLLAAKFAAWGPGISATFQYGVSKRGEAEAADSGSLTLAAQIPLDGFLPFSSGAMSIQSQKDNVAALELALKDAELTAKVNSENSLKKIRQQIENIKTTQSSIELAQQTYDMCAQAYSRGTKDLLTLQNASEKLLSAQVQLKSCCYGLLSGILELENQIGVEYGTLLK